MSKELTAIQTRLDDVLLVISGIDDPQTRAVIRALTGCVLDLSKLIEVEDTNEYCTILGTKQLVVEGEVE